MTVKNALVVDDSKSARFAMRKFLESAGYQVETADSALEAYAALQARLPDVIFLDHVMPDIDGLEALGAIRQEARTAAIPIVLCSSHEDAEFVKNAQARGAVSVLLKPPSPQQIAEVLRQVEQPPVAARLAPAMPNRVQSIREPEVAIEQAVMKTLREAMPAAVSAPPALRVVASSLAPAVARVTAPVARPDALRAEMESRLEKITQALYADLADTRARLSHLDGDLRREDQIRAMIAEALDEQFAIVTRHFEARIASLRCDVDDLLSAQDARIAQLDSELRESVAAEAHAVSERVVMSAAARISDQIAASILNVLKPDLARASG
ncbi:MAG: hypothetical protein NVS9B10_19730 [Nevskia sp.]